MVATLGTFASGFVLRRIGRIFFAEYVGLALRISLTLRTSSLACDGPRLFLGAVGLSSRVDSLRLSKLLSQLQRWKRGRCMPKCRHVRLALGFPSLENLYDSSRCWSKILRRCLALADRFVVSSFADSPWRGDGVMMVVGHPMRPFMAAPPANVLWYAHSTRGGCPIFFMRLGSFLRKTGGNTRERALR